MQGVVAGIIGISGYYLICQRHTASLRFPLKWEFPGGKIKEGESPKKALKRELMEELGIRVIKCKPYLSYHFQYENEEPFELHFFLVGEYENTLQNLQFNQTAWLRPDQMRRFDFLAGDLPLLDKLEKDKSLMN